MAAVARQAERLYLDTRWVHDFGVSNLSNRREVVLAVVAAEGSALEYACQELQHDIEVVLTAVSQDGLALQHAATELQCVRAVALAAVSQNGWAFPLLSNDLQFDREIALAAVSRNGLVLRVVPAALQNERRIALAAVKENGWALEYASKTMRNNRQVVLAAVSQQEVALQWAADELLEDESFAPNVRANFYFVKVRMLSGNTVVVPIHVDAARFRRKENVIEACLKKLGLTPGCRPRGELFQETRSIPEGDSVNKWPGVGLGKVTEFHLLAFLSPPQAQ
mmetsp:Transcript_59838/g.110803  ORF Transcript_59838/g.110803 Transcript_59838/m.110803 type:complete len:280 (-) Transcript_59838:18-857(-)